MNVLKVLSAGILTLIQDLGRNRVAHLGLSTGGPLDIHAFCWANRLVGNHSNQPALEITMGAFSVEAYSDVVLSLTGANCSATIDGQRLESWRSFVLHKGQVLKLGYARQGFRAYLAIQGGFDIAPCFDSVATVVRNQMGGLLVRPGTSLKRDDWLAVNGDSAIPEPTYRPHFVVSRFIPNYDDEIEIGVIESYQANLFPDDAKKRFYASPYLVSDKLDRMGIRLSGEKIHCDSVGIISEGIALGSIQFPPNGQPIILTHDRQTLGGYPKLGCVSRMSLMRLAQARPGTKLNFYQAELDKESQAYFAFMRFFGL